MGRMMPGQFVDGRIAFLKAELKITPAQEPQWQRVEAAMRENAKDLDQTTSAARQNRSGMDAVQRLESREQFAKVRADNDARLLAAFKPLYGSLSPEQQQMANQLVGAHQHRQPSRLTPTASLPREPPIHLGGFLFHHRGNRRQRAPKGGERVGLRSAQPGSATDALDQQDQAPEKQHGAADERVETGQIDQ